jgi:hypothetical protein
MESTLKPWQRPPPENPDETNTMRVYSNELFSDLVVTAAHIDREEKRKVCVKIIMKNVFNNVLLSISN